MRRGNQPRPRCLQWFGMENTHNEMFRLPTELSCQLHIKIFLYNGIWGNFLTPI